MMQNVTFTGKIKFTGFVYIQFITIIFSLLINYLNK